jgi:hypothetical protein
MKLLKHKSETLETYACNMRFQRNMYSLLGWMEAVAMQSSMLAELDAVEWR